MTWPMPHSGQWNPNIAMTSHMNLGYTPDQWTLMQQQNWQQWAQWQQQYTQWQAQYGEKYAEQMQTVQAVGVVPPLPPMNCLPPPAPPPPKEPPPPHQNDQPLYTHKPPPPPVPVPSELSSKPNNMIPLESNIHNWSCATESHSFSQNSDALEKLSEEERLFDIQFQKWEEEIDKWKKENVNHPDKQAYSEYEQKFEACKAQLLERRQVMKQKRTMLMSNTSQNSNTASTENRSIVSTSLRNANMNNYPSNNLQTQNFNNILGTNYSFQNQTQYQHFNSTDQTNFTNDYPQMDMQYNKSHVNLDTTLSPGKDNSNFLPTKETTNGIPGLDLVPQVEKSALNKSDVIDITVENMEENQGISLQGPDYSTISKGINNILGDEKIMNILTMVRQKNSNSVNTIQMQNHLQPVITQQYPNNAANVNRQNIAYDVKESYNMLRTGNEQFNLRQYESSQNNAGNEKFYGHYVQNSSQEMLPGSQLIPRQVTQPLQNQLMQTNFDNYDRVSHDERNILRHDIHSMSMQPVRSKWVDQPLFTPSIIVEYEHKPLRLKARDFIEPVHMFDYNHKSRRSDNKKKDFEREVDDLFSRQTRIKDMNNDNFTRERLYREPYHRDYERKTRDINREDYRQKFPSREGYDERRRHDIRYDDRKYDDSEKYRRREDIFRDRDKGRDRDEYKDYRRDENRNRSKSKEKENRKRERSKEIEVVGGYPIKKGKETSENSEFVKAKHIVMIDDLLEPPGREMRPEKIVIILRGLPGSGKSYLAKLIRDKEAEHGGTVRIMSIDDYFMQEGEIEVNDNVSGKVIKKPLLKYEFDQDLEESYMNSLKRAFKRSLTDGYFTFLIFDAVNEHLKSYADIWNFARQNGFQVYICTMEADVATCHKRNIHNRTLEDINKIHHTFYPTPEHHIQLDATTLLQSAAIPEVQMEDADDAVTMEDVAETEVENHFTSKWEKMDDAAQLARLDGTSKPLRPSQLSMEDYLQIDDWKPSVAKPGKKTDGINKKKIAFTTPCNRPWVKVRWADIEERRQQEKMRAIGFVVGQTDWNRMTDPTMGSSALTQTMYIERVRRM